MQIPSLEEGNIIKVAKSNFRLNKLKAETNEAKIKSIKKPFKLEKENKAIKDRRINDISNLFRLEKGSKAIELIEYRKLEDVRNLFEHEEKESYCKLYRVSNFWSNNYIIYKSNGDKNKLLSVEIYFNKIKSHLKDIINDIKKSGRLKN